MFSEHFLTVSQIFISYFPDFLQKRIAFSRYNTYDPSKKLTIVPDTEVITRLYGEVNTFYQKDKLWTFPEHVEFVMNDEFWGRVSHYSLCTFATFFQHF